MSASPWLLAFTGHGYDSRVSVGPAPPISGDDLQTTLGLSRSSFEFGVGICGESAFVLLRRLILAGTRNYPIALLLDPGEERWRELGWNAAWLADWLVVPRGGGESRFDVLSNRGTSGEALDCDLELAVQGYWKWQSGRRATGGSSRSVARDELAGLICGGDSVGGELALLPWAAIHSNLSPTPAGMAEMIEDLPIPLRLVHGWIVGPAWRGRPTFGASVVLDPAREEPPTNAEREVARIWIAAGRERLAAWEDAGKLIQDLLASRGTVPSSDSWETERSRIIAAPLPMAVEEAPAFHDTPVAAGGGPAVSQEELFPMAADEDSISLKGQQGSNPSENGAVLAADGLAAEPNRASELTSQATPEALRSSVPPEGPVAESAPKLSEPRPDPPVAGNQLARKAWHELFDQVDDEFREHSLLPAWLWTDASNAFRRLRSLHLVLSRESWDSATEDAAGEAASASGPFAESLRKALLALALTDTGSPLQLAATATILAAHLNRAIAAIPLEILNRLDPESAVRVLVANGWPLNEGPISRDQVPATWWGPLVREWPKIETLPQVAAWILGNALPARHRELLDAAFKRWREAGQTELERWNIKSTDERVIARLKALQREVAIEELKTARAGWEKNYLRFGLEGPGKPELTGLDEIEDRRLATLVDTALRLCASATPGSPSFFRMLEKDGKKWRLSPQDLLSVANKLGEPWYSFFALRSIEIESRAPTAEYRSRIGKPMHLEVKKKAQQLEAAFSNERKRKSFKELVSEVFLGEEERGRQDRPKQPQIPVSEPRQGLVHRVLRPLRHPGRILGVVNDFFWTRDEPPPGDIEPALPQGDQPPKSLESKD